MRLAALTMFPLLSPRVSNHSLDDALLQQISLNAQPNPNPRDLKELRYWLRHIREGKSSLRGPGSWIYSENYGNELSDMIPLSTARAQREFFTRLITKLVDRTIFHIPEWLIEVKFIN